MKNICNEIVIDYSTGTEFGYLDDEIDTNDAELADEGEFAELDFSGDVTVDYDGGYPSGNLYEALFDKAQKKAELARLENDIPLIIGCYGTLRVGMPNNGLMVANRCSYIGSRRVKGYALWHTPNSIIPYARKSDNESIMVDLFYVDTAKALLALDSLEGHPTHYVRVPVAGMPFSIYEDANPKESTTGWTDAFYTKKYNLPKVAPVMYEKIPNGDYSKWYIAYQQELLAEKLDNLKLMQMEIRETEEELADTLEILSDIELEDYAKTLL